MKPLDSQVAEAPARVWTRLRAYNVGMGLLHLAQGLLILVLSNGFSLPVTANFLEGPPGTEATFTELFSIESAWGVAIFLFISAAAHLTLASPWVFGWYRERLKHDRNAARWIEYAFSSSVMIVLIAMLTGISDVAALVALAGVNAAMILFGLIMERDEVPGRARWLAFWLGTLCGAIPWIAIGIYLVSPGIDASPPGFVWGIFISLFILFYCCAVTMILPYRRIGPWRNDLVGESTYILLSLTAKSALAWQVFGGTLATGRGRQGAR